ncbi:hypothetical protein K5F93_19980 [Pseudomonas protegens]|uniref:hypothetical protein n=1 Tax=Pseudomonas protegens TaxID=380021 RepID=UPI001C8D1EF7|nr:hypothetical protein [Pseudomonas protegens]QZI68669.1 hypothetical protein K5F93_19980 [Pseudomonas protegens]
MKTLDQRVLELEQAANSTASAATNAIGSLIRAVTNLPEINRQALWDDLESVKSLQIQNGNQVMYVEMLTLLQKHIR